MGKINGFFFGLNSGLAVVCFMIGEPAFAAINAAAAALNGYFFFTSK